MNHNLVETLTHYCNVPINRCAPITHHTINYYDLSFVLDGSIVYYVNGAKYLLQKNDAIFIKPGSVRARESGSKTGQFISFNFIAPEDVTFSFSDYMPQRITREIRQLISLYPHSHLSPSYYSKEKCTSMLNYVLWELLNKTNTQSSNEYIAKILRYIEEHITENITRDDISAYTHLSKGYISYIFKQEIGMGLIDYINNRKILLARDLICSKEMSLSDISDYLGFENYNYFSRLFRKYLEISPIALRKKN